MTTHGDEPRHHTPASTPTRRAALAAPGANAKARGRRVTWEVRAAAVEELLAHRAAGAAG